MVAGGTAAAAAPGLIGRQAQARPGTNECCRGRINSDLGLRSGFDPPDLDRPGPAGQAARPHQEGTVTVTVTL